MLKGESARYGWLAWPERDVVGVQRRAGPTLTPSVFQANPLSQHKLTYETSSWSNRVRENAVSIRL